MTISSPSVLVIGGGPIGLTLAGDLGWRGVSCLLVEKGDGTVAQPRMDMVGVRSMEFCRRWGIVDWVHAAGYNRDYPQDGAWATSLNGYEFGREPFPPPAQERPPAGVGWCWCAPTARWWRGDALPADVKRLVDTVRGAIASEPRPVSFDAVIAED